MIPIAKPLIGEEEKRAVLEVLDSGMLACGEVVKNFENQFADYIGTKHAIATSNGTTALHVALLAHNIKENDEVITTPFTFIATANAIKMAGATPVFVDIGTDFNINPDLIEQAITKRTKAILLVHLYGKPCNLERIQEIANKHHLIIIEDCAQAHGATYNGKKVGSANTGCFSFYPTKNMTTSEGGMITTNNEVIAEKARMLISHGSKKKYNHHFLGFNYRMTNIAAAIGIEQLKKLPKLNQKRIENANFYNKELKQKESPGHVYHQYTIITNNREEFIQHMKNEGIQTVVHYPIPIHKQKAYNLGQSFPVAEEAAKRVVSIPVHPGLTEEDKIKIVNTIREDFAK